MKNRYSTLAWMASLAGMVAVLSSGCNGTSEQSGTPEPRTVMVERTVEVTAQPSSSEESTTLSEAEMDCEIGQACDLGESTVTVTSTQQSQSINTSLGDTFEGNFVIVEFDYTYGGNEPVDLGEPPFQLQDESGNGYSLNFDATSSYGIDNDRSLIYETVQPSVAAQGTAIFEVSPEAENFTLVVMDLVSPQTNMSASIPLTGSGQPTSSPLDNSTPQEETTSAVTSPDSFVSSYYEAVSREDWSATYAMLDSESQAVFTEDEWVQKQVARNASASPPPLTRVIVNMVSGQGSDQIANITLNYDDGSQETLDVTIRAQGGEYKRHLTADEIVFLQNL